MAEGFAAMNPLGKAGTTQLNSHDASYQRVYDIALNNLLKALSSSQTTAAVPLGVVNTLGGYACGTSGSYSVSWNDANNNDIKDVGDSYSVAYNQCVESYAAGGITYTYTDNGTFTFTETALTGDPTVANSSWTAGMSFAMNMSTSWSATDGTSGSETLSGGASLTAAYDQATTTSSGSFSGSSLKMSASYTSPSGTQQMSFELANLNFAATDNASNGSYTADIDYTLRADAIGGSVTVNTNPVFAGVSPNPPTSGTVVITGADNTKLTLVANSDGATVTITVNNDAPQTYTWVQLGGW